MDATNLLPGSIWAVMESAGGLPTMRSLELLTAGRQLGMAGRPLVAIGMGLMGIAPRLFGLGADQVIGGDSLASDAVEPKLAVLTQLAQVAMPEVILLENTPAAQELAGRLAVRLNGSLVSDCIAFEAGRLIVHPIFGDLMRATVMPRSWPLIATVRSGAFGPPQDDPERSGDVLEFDVSAANMDSRVSLMQVIERALAFAPIAEARIVVAGGMGLGDPATFQWLEAIATALQGAVGCSRAVVEAGWRPYSEQIGLTGQTIAPSLYLACGIHGASQHLDGIRGSRTIIAINNDPHAPLMKQADVAMVGDAKELLPALLQELRKAN